MTAQQIFEIAMTLIDETPVNGVFDVDRTSDYVAKTPYLLTMLQNELIRTSNYYKTETITVASAVDTAGHYISHTMPVDFKGLYQMVSIENGNEYELSTDFKWEGNALLIPDTFIGVIKVVYYPIPSSITAMTDTLVLDGITCSTTLANGLASQLILTENPDLASYLNERYNELKNIKQSSSQIVEIKDVYDSKLSY